MHFNRMNVGQTKHNWSPTPFLLFLAKYCMWTCTCFRKFYV